MPTINVATAAGAPRLNGASTEELDFEYKVATQEFVRSEIDPVPGSGVTRGVWYFKDNAYAFRDDELGLTCKMFKATESGWVEVVTGVTLSPGGVYEFVNYNFLGHSGSLKMYGVDGVNKGFQFDGTTFTQISTGMTIDTPNHLFAHKKHLFFSFLGGSVQHSSLGTPLVWSPITGAAELAMGDECTGFELGSIDALTIFTRNNTKILYGTSVADWNLTDFSSESGAVAGSIQRLGKPVYLDDRGLTTLGTVQAYGDFKSNSISKKMDKILNSLRGKLITSIRVRDKDQYRLYFNDNTIMTFTFVEGKLKGIMRQDYGITVRTACSSETSDGSEIMFFGCDTGFIYKIDSGPNFDGEVVNAWVRPAFNHFKSPENFKRFFKIVLEIDANEENQLFFIPSFDYGGVDTPVAIEGEVNVSGGGGFWDAAIWEDFFYDAQVISTAFGYLTGIGKNFSLYIRSAGQYETPHVLQGVIIHHSVKGLSK